MSTFSWSYKTASHRHPPSKKISTGEGESSVDKPRVEKHLIISSLNNIQTGTPKRLNWKAKIYVGNLNKKTNEASLAYYFSVFGDIDDVKLIRDHNTNESRGFAFITFEKIESAEKAKKWCAYNYPTLDDNRITVASAERKLPKAKAVPLNEYAAPRHPSQTLFWEYKWTNERDAEVYGPYETSLMLAWKNQGYFDGGCWVRQVFRQDRHAEEKQAEEEDCEVAPAKKLKRMIDYSDSEEEDASGEEDERRPGKSRGEERGGGEAEGGGEKEKGGAGKIREESRGASEREATGKAEEGSKQEEGGTGEKEKSTGKEKRGATTAAGEESGRRVAEEDREDEATGRTKESQGEEAAGIKDREREGGSKVAEGGEGEEERKEGGAREHEGTGNETRDKVICLTGRGEESEREQKHKQQENQHGRGGDNDDCQRKTIKEYLRTDLTVGSEKERLGSEVENNKNDKEYSSSDDEDVKDVDNDLCTEFVDISEIDFNFFP